MARSPAPSTRAVRVAHDAGVVVETRAYPADGKVAGPEVARLLALDPAAVLKTLVVDAGSALVVALVPVEATLDLKALARHVDAKRASLADPATAEGATGYRLGAISPLGQRRRHRTVIDTSARDHDRVWVSGGAHGLELGLAVTDLVRLTGAEWAALVGGS